MNWLLAIYDMQLWFDDDFKPQIVKEIDFEPEIGLNLEIEGKVYHICSLHHKKQIAGARVIEFVEEPEEEYDGDFKCPYCSYINYDAFELEDEGETKCGRCGSEVEYSREVSISYSVSPKRKNEAIKIS